MTEPREKILEILTEIRPEVDYGAATDYVAEGLLDSTDIVSLVASLDEAYGISIEGTEILPEHFRNVDTIVTLLAKYGVGT